tara:strand:- start:50053 stop:51966 length:1914 start_codon:yes stop_codon:yes gene_type:complete
MIQGQIFNFESNKLEASKYRNSLQNLGKGSSNQMESFLINRRLNFKRIRFPFLLKRGIIDAQLIDSNFRNLNSYLYYVNTNINSIEKITESFKRKTKDFFKVLNKELELLLSSIEETNIRLNSKFNKVVNFRIFQEKDFEEQYDLMDVKRDLRLRKAEQCSYKRGYIECKETNINLVDIVSVEVVKEESFYSDSLKALNISEDNSLIYRPNKFWHYIVAAKDSLIDLQKLPHKNVSVSLIFNFDGYEDLNNIFIEFGSSLPVLIDKNQLEYFDLETESYIKLDDASVQKNNNRVEISFRTKRTNKLKIKLFQKKYHDTSFVYDDDLDEIKKDNILNGSFLNYSSKIKEFELKRVYDLSILNFECRRKTNKGLGFYREANPVVINKPLSLQIKPKIFFESEYSFIEKYAHIVLYGEKNFKAHKKISENYTNTKRVNIKIPIPNSPYKEQELLILQNKIGRLNFFPNMKMSLKDSVKIEAVSMSTGEKRILNENEFSISLDGGSKYTDDENPAIDMDTVLNEMNRSVIESKIYNFYIKINAPSKSHFYIAEYALNKNIRCGHGDELLISQGEIVFNKNFQSSVGFVRPSFIIRNKSRDNQSSKISSYNVLVEEMETNEKSYIEYETFVELERRGSSNVV